MVIERFHEGRIDEIYQRFHTNGRMLPDGLYYVASWLSKEKNTCFQLMETSNSQLFKEWFSHWQDLTDFEIYPLARTTDEPKVSHATYS